jgi:hypothetical protein
MSANSQEIVQQVRQEFEAMITKMILPHTQAPRTADEMERDLWKFMLQQGRSLMAAFLVHRAEEIAPKQVALNQTQALPPHDVVERSYHCVFGKIRFARRYYYRHGHGAFPLDADLNLPLNATSDLLREWQERLGASLPYTEANSILESFLRHPFSNRALQEAILEDAKQVRDFYEQRGSPLPDPQATLLIVQADGKGVPLVKDTDPKSPVRAGKGAKPGKKEAIVTTVYTLAPAPRTPESVLASLFHPEIKTDPAPRSGPHNKWLFATLEGKREALRVTAEQVGRQEGAHILERVALTDGAEALQTRVQTQFPDFTLVLDFIHADEYLWKAANALLGETAPQRSAWVEKRTLQMLSGQISAVVADLRETASECKSSSIMSQTLLSVASYFERNQAYMQYDKYLASGWPIASGVIEGACRHLVKDRCELSGMRWTQSGAEALLGLRSVLENGDWESFHAYRRRQRQKKVYGYWEIVQPDETTTPLRFAA